MKPRMAGQGQVLLVPALRLQPRETFFFFIIGHTPWHVGFQFPKQGSNLGPCFERRSLNHGTTREVPDGDVEASLRLGGKDRCSQRKSWPWGPPWWSTG